MDRDRIQELVDELVDERSTEALERLTGSSNERVLSALIEAAGKILDDERPDDADDTLIEEIQAHLAKCAKTGPLVDALEHKSPSVREFALGCLGEIGDVSTAEPIIARLEDEDQAVREAALEHLTLLTDQDFGNDPAAWREWVADVAQRDKLRVKEEREELAEKKKRRSKVLADVEETDGDDNAGHYGDDDDERPRRRRDEDETDDDERVASVDREDDFS